MSHAKRKNLGTSNIQNNKNILIEIHMAEKYYTSTRPKIFCKKRKLGWIRYTEFLINVQCQEDIILVQQFIL